MRFRKKPIEVEAVQWTGENREEIHAFIGDTPHAIVEKTVRIWGATAAVGDWLTRTETDYFTSLTHAAFQANYEPASAPQPALDEADRERLHAAARLLTEVTEGPDPHADGLIAFLRSLASRQPDSGGTD